MRSLVFYWTSPIGHVVICWMSIVLQIEDLKNDNALLRAQLQQHGLEISETSSQWQKNKNSLSSGEITPQWHTCSQLITELRSAATQVGYDTQTHPSDKWLWTLWNNICCSSAFCFLLHFRKNSTTWTRSIWNNPLLPEISRLPQVFVFCFNFGFVNQLYACSCLMLISCSVWNILWILFLLHRVTTVSNMTKGIFRGFWVLYLLAFKKLRSSRYAKPWLMFWIWFCFSVLRSFHISDFCELRSSGWSETWHCGTSRLIYSINLLNVKVHRVCFHLK